MSTATRSQSTSASEFVVGELPSFSGAADAEARKYKRLDCARGVWLVAQQPNEGDNVYFHNPRDKNSDGFGGGTLHFPLIDGGVYEAKGPWKSNAGDLFKDTGYDAREKHLSFVVIGRAVEFRKNPRSSWGSNRVISDIVYRDPAGGLIGNFYRFKQILVSLPNGQYHFYSETPGGSHAGREDVDDWWRAEINAGRFNPIRPKERRA